MGRTALVLVVLFALAVRQTGAVVNLSTWKPMCLTNYSVYLPKDPLFEHFTVNVSTPPGKICTEGTYGDLDKQDHTIPASCFSVPTIEVTLALQDKNVSKTVKGGLHYAEAHISCTVDGNGRLQNVAANVTVNAVTTVIPVTPEFQGISLNLELATENAASGNSASYVFLGQENVYLRVKHTASANDHYVLAPISCAGKNDKGTETFPFFLASDTTCNYDSDVMGSLTLNADIASAQFYPFKFTSGDKVNLTCEILICPSGTKAGTANYCEKVLTALKACSPQSPLTSTTPATTVATAAATTKSPGTLKRRRRAAGGQETHTRVLEVTYSVLDPGPVLQGPTAGGAGAAISVPLLAAVASLWML